jgi:UDP-galactopyranose mutase
MPEHWDYLIAGAGFAGAVLAERLANGLGKKVLIVDRRPHIGGNSYDHKDAAGVLVHTYGPHYFRTNSERIRAYLSQFTEWHPVDYKILSWTDGRYWQFPINLNTFEQFIGRPSTSEEMEATLAEWRVPIEEPKNSEEVIVSQVGWQLYKKFFEGPVCVDASPSAPTGMTAIFPKNFRRSPRMDTRPCSNESLVPHRGYA